jgi:hypothetical protein
MFTGSAISPCPNADNTSLVCCPINLSPPRPLSFSPRGYRPNTAHTTVLEETVDENISTCVEYLKRMAPMKQWLEMEIGITV